MYCTKKFAGIKSEKLKVFIIEFYDISKIYYVAFKLLCSVILSYFYFLYSWFSILDKSKTTLNYRLKLNNDNNWSFSVAYSPIIKLT